MPSLESLQNFKQILNIQVVFVYVDIDPDWILSLATPTLEELLGLSENLVRMVAGPDQHSALTNPLLLQESYVVLLDTILASRTSLTLLFLIGVFGGVLRNSQAENKLSLAGLGPFACFAVELPEVHRLHALSKIMASKMGHLNLQHSQLENVKAFLVSLCTKWIRDQQYSSILPFICLGDISFSQQSHSIAKKHYKDALILESSFTNDLERIADSWNHDYVVRLIWCCVEMKDFLEGAFYEACKSPKDFNRVYTLLEGAKLTPSSFIDYSFFLVDTRPILFTHDLILEKFLSKMQETSDGKVIVDRVIANMRKPTSPTMVKLEEHHLQRMVLLRQVL